MTVSEAPWYSLKRSDKPLVVEFLESCQMQHNQSKSCFGHGNGLDDFEATSHLNLFLSESHLENGATFVLYYKVNKFQLI